MSNYLLSGSAPTRPIDQILLVFGTNIIANVITVAPNFRYMSLRVLAGKNASPRTDTCNIGPSHINDVVAEFRSGAYAFCIQPSSGLSMYEAHSVYFQGDITDTSVPDGPFIVAHFFVNGVVEDAHPQLCGVFNTVV